jgi:hypothetical protein
MRRACARLDFIKSHLGGDTKKKRACVYITLLLLYLMDCALDNKIALSAVWRVCSNFDWSAIQVLIIM